MSKPVKTELQLVHEALAEHPTFRKMDVSFTIHDSTSKPMDEKAIVLDLVPIENIESIESVIKSINELKELVTNYPNSSIYLTSHFNKIAYGYAKISKDSIYFIKDFVKDIAYYIDIYKNILYTLDCKTLTLTSSNGQTKTFDTIDNVKSHLLSI